MKCEKCTATPYLSTQWVVCNHHGVFFLYLFLSRSFILQDFFIFQDFFEKSFVNCVSWKSVFLFRVYAYTDWRKKKLAEGEDHLHQIYIWDQDFKRKRKKEKNWSKCKTSYSSHLQFLKPYWTRKIRFDGRSSVGGTRAFMSLCQGLEL